MSKEIQNQEPQIVKAVPEDALGITTVLYKTWLDTYPNPELGITKEDIEESYKESFSQESLDNQKLNIESTPKNQLRLVAKVNGQVVGVSTVVVNEDFNQLRTIYVLPDFQGKGIGRLLWEEAKKFCDQKKPTIVQVATYNQKALSFYKSLGFVDTGKRWSDPKWKMKSGATIPEMEMVLKIENFSNMPCC
jgi:ribosomal protein S18 acetylase RimI-like enzyme